MYCSGGCIVKALGMWVTRGVAMPIEVVCYCRGLIVNKQKVVLAAASSAYKHSLKEVLTSPGVAGQIKVLRTPHATHQALRVHGHTPLYAHTYTAILCASHSLVAYSLQLSIAYRCLHVVPSRQTPVMQGCLIITDGMCRPDMPHECTWTQQGLTALL